MPCWLLWRGACSHTMAEALARRTEPCTGSWRAWRMAGRSRTARKSLSSQAEAEESGTGVRQAAALAVAAPCVRCMRALPYNIGDRCADSRNLPIVLGGPVLGDAGEGSFTPHGWSSSLYRALQIPHLAGALGGAAPQLRCEGVSIASRLLCNSSKKFAAARTSALE